MATTGDGGSEVESTDSKTEKTQRRERERETGTERQKAFIFRRQNLDSVVGERKRERQTVRENLVGALV